MTIHTRKDARIKDVKRHEHLMLLLGGGNKARVIVDSKIVLVPDDGWAFGALGRT